MIRAVIITSVFCKCLGHMPQHLVSHIDRGHNRLTPWCAGRIQCHGTTRSVTKHTTEILDTKIGNQCGSAEK